ncbi:MAG: transaldolase, partial [Chloroflexi bacterium]|nr:transaldolase [Chloroflexota bacterium]
GQAGDGGDAGTLKALEGKAAIANARIAYARFQEVFGSDRFAALRAKGARVQRPLWASTSTKNPEYRDTMYVEDLAGRHIVNTMPPATIDAVRDHGKITCGSVTQQVAESRQFMDSLREAGIDIDEVTDQLTVEGVDSFSKSLNSLFSTIKEKAEKIGAARNVQPAQAR